MRAPSRVTAVFPMALAALAIVAGCGSTGGRHPASAAATRSPAASAASVSPATPSKSARSLAPQQATECATVAAAYRTWLATGPPATVADVQAVTINQDFVFVNATTAFENALFPYHDLPAANLAVPVANYGVAMANLGVVLTGGAPKTDQVYTDVVNWATAVRDQYATFEATAC